MAGTKSGVTAKLARGKQQELGVTSEAGETFNE